MLGLCHIDIRDSCRSTDIKRRTAVDMCFLYELSLLSSDVIIIFNC